MCPFHSYGFLLYASIVLHHKETRRDSVKNRVNYVPISDFKISN